MSPFEAALLATAVVAGLINFNHLRALAWLTAGIVNYLVTSAYFDGGFPLHPFFTACADATVCLLIFFHGRVRWELPLFTVFQFSVMVSFTKLIGLPDDYLYALLLELVNWVALFILIGAGTARLADAIMGEHGRRARGDYLRRLVHSVSAPAKVDTWWWARWGHPS